ncbi:hypothetical protein EMCRGX_G002629 [Ephydatia muelleri]
MGKACRILLSSGIAPSNSTTLNLLQSKNPSCPHPTIPDIASNPVTLGPSFDILHFLRSFTKGVQQGDPLGPMLFALVLHKLVSSIEADDDCINLSFNAWYLDDGLLAGERSAVVRALHLIDELGPHLGLLINYPKCEVFSRNGTEALEEVRTWTGSRWHWP